MLIQFTNDKGKRLFIESTMIEAIYLSIDPALVTIVTAGSETSYHVQGKLVDVATEVERTNQKHAGLYR